MGDAGDQIVQEVVTTMRIESSDSENNSKDNENDESDSSMEKEMVEKEIPRHMTASEENAQVTDEDFEKLFRIRKSTFLDLQREIHDKETDCFDTNLLTCLWILGNVASLADISTIFTYGEDSLRLICKKYFQKIVALAPKYISWPSPLDMLTLDYSFEKQYEFSGVIGALGCLYISANPQTEEDSNTCDSTTYFPQDIVYLQAVCDSNLLFRDVFLGSPADKSIKEILQVSPLYQKLTSKDCQLKKMNKHILGGTEHPPLDTLLTPYPFNEESELTPEQLKFNSLHSGVMTVLDKTFYLIERRFQRMKNLESDIEFATLALGAICVLHNFTRVRGDNYDG